MWHFVFNACCVHYANRSNITMYCCRYVTLMPIPACSLGIFVGAVQTFRSPVYGSTGFVCTEV